MRVSKRELVCIVFMRNAGQLWYASDQCDGSKSVLTHIAVRSNGMGAAAAWCRSVCAGDVCGGDVAGL